MKLVRLLLGPHSSLCHYFDWNQPACALPPSPWTPLTAVTVPSACPHLAAWSQSVARAWSSWSCHQWNRWATPRFSPSARRNLPTAAASDPVTPLASSAPTKRWRRLCRRNRHSQSRRTALGRRVVVRVKKSLKNLFTDTKEEGESLLFSRRAGCGGRGGGCSDKDRFIYLHYSHHCEPVKENVQTL